MLDLAVFGPFHSETRKCEVDCLICHIHPKPLFELLRPLLQSVQTATNACKHDGSEESLLVVSSPSTSLFMNFPKPSSNRILLQARHPCRTRRACPSLRRHDMYSRRQQYRGLDIRTIIVPYRPQDSSIETKHCSTSLYYTIHYTALNLGPKPAPRSCMPHNKPYKLYVF